MIKILYTDDESSLLDIAKMFLERSGEFSVTTAISAPEAIRLLEQEKFDAIISDYQMPEMDGIQFLIEVRSRFGSIPFILFTGRGREEIVIQAINSGADFYLQKGGEPKSQFAELAHKIKSAASRKRGEDALRRSEEKFRMIVENSHDIIYTLTAEGEFIFVSPAWTALLGHPVTQVVGQSFTKFVHPDDISPWLLFLKSVIETGEQQEGIEYRVLHSNGVWEWHTSSAVPIKDETGTITGFYGIARDITESKRAEKALKEQLDSLAENEWILQLNEKRLLMAQEISRTGCWEYNLKTDTIWGSAEAHRIFGLSHDAGEIPLDELESCIQEREQVHQTLVDLINAGKEYDLEFVINPADGSAQKVIHSIARIEKDAGGKPIRVVGVIQDITRRKQGDIFRQLSTDVLGILSEPAELQEVIVRVLTAIKQVTKADAVGVRLKTDDDFPYFVENGFSHDFLLKENTLVARDPDGGICHDSEGNVSLECTCGLVISGKRDPDNPLFTPGGSIWTNNSFPFLKLPEKDDPRFHPRNTCIHEGYASVALIPIRKNQQIIGILQINAYKNDCFTPEIIQSLEQIAGHIGEALMRKQAEESMRESEEKLTAIVAGSPVPKFVIDKDHKIIYWNRALEQTTGISAAQVMGTKKQWQAFYNKERPTMADLILDEAFAHISEFYAGKFSESPLVTGAFEATDFFPHMGEKGTYLRFMAAPIKNLHGDILGAVETLIDVSDIKRAEVELETKNEELGAAFEEITATEEELRQQVEEIAKAQEVLRETEQRYRNIVDDQTEFICRFLPDGTHVFVNDAYCRYFGVPRKDIIGHTFSPVLFADDKKAVAAFFATLTEEKPVGTIDQRIIMPDGTIRWQRWSDRAIFDDKGNVVEYQSVGRDITEYKEMEAQLQTASKEYQNLLENISDVYYRSDAQGRLILASQSWATLLNYPDLSECIGKNIAGEFYANPGDRSQFLSAVYQNGYVTDYEITLKKKDGTPVTVATSSYLYFDAAGHVLGVEGTFRDISERKRITEVLKETGQRLTDIISFLPDATFAIDGEGKVIAWNHAIEELTGVPAGDMIGKGDYEYALPFYGVRRPILIDLIDTPDAELETNYSSVRRHGKILTAETGMAHVGGTNRILWGKASPLYNFRNEVVGAIESIRDFTEQRILEDSLKQVNKKLNLMSSITRHDVSNNITVCLGYLELSKHKSLHPEMQKLIDILEKNIGAIQSQINFTRVYQDLGVAAPVWQDLGGLLRECSSAGKIPVIYDITNLQIYTDPLISKVFYNLYDNAVRHGERVTEIHVRAQERGRDMVIIWEDNGIGVLQNEKEKIFNRGFGKNTGLGLFLVREILSITGMSILENGETGKGARFEMRVPKGMWRIMGDIK